MVKEGVGHEKGDSLACPSDPKDRRLEPKGACPVSFPREDSLSRQKRIKTLFHRLWSKAVSSEDYDKREWQELQELLKIEELGVRGGKG
ncbi:MAG: hypothetical protein AB9873_14960 [Syntrophobacteraceae bacterium]